MASKPHCPTWYVSSSHTFVARGHVCPLIHCDLCNQNLLRTEYEDHILAHQLESTHISDTSKDQEYARRLQGQGRSPPAVRSARVPPDIEHLLTALPPGVRSIITQIHQSQRLGPSTVVIRQRLNPWPELPSRPHPSRGQGLQSSAIDNLPTTAYREGGDDRQCVVC